MQNYEQHMPIVNEYVEVLVTNSKFTVYDQFVQTLMERCYPELDSDQIEDAIQFTEYPAFDIRTKRLWRYGIEGMTPEFIDGETFKSRIVEHDPAWRAICDFVEVIGVAYQRYIRELIRSLRARRSSEDQLLEHLIQRFGSLDV